MLFFGSLISFLCLSGSLTIFHQYRCLRCDRLNIQTHLLLSLLLRCVPLFVIAEPVILDHQNSYRDVDILCEAVLVLFLYTTFASVTWMFIQGLYLNITLMKATPNVNCEKNLRRYHAVGWGVPAVFMFIYVIAMTIKKQEKCWLGYSKMKEIWILLGPIILVLILNTLFLLNVLRILVKKLRNSSTRPDSSQIRAAAKAVAILSPVLGLNNLMLLYNPSGEYYKYFMLLNTFFGSTQGVFVSIVFCFCNKEVVAAIRRSLQRARARRIDIPDQSQSINQNQIGGVQMIELDMQQPPN